MLRDTAAEMLFAPLEEVAPARPAFEKPVWWWDEPIRDNYDGRSRAIVKAFLTGTLHGKVDGGSTNGRHIYSTRKDGAELWLFKDNPSVKIRVCLARKVNGVFIGNASSVQAQRINGKLNWIGGILKIQTVLQDTMPMILDRTFCSGTRCPKVDTCDRSTTTLRRWMESRGATLPDYIEVRLTRISVAEFSPPEGGSCDRYHSVDETGE